MEKSYNIILGQETFEKIDDYVSFIKDGGQCGKNLSRILSNESLDLLSQKRNSYPSLDNLDAINLLRTLLNTKYSQIFAESAVIGDGTDWTLTELGLLGDISIGMSVTIYDNGAHQNPLIHDNPFVGHLVYTPGALLRNDQGYTPADWQNVTQDGKCDKEKYYRLYERRLLPAFRYINSKAMVRKNPAFVTIPGIGCGQFAGPFRGQMGHLFKETLYRFLYNHGQSFSNIKAVYYDPYNECVDETHLLNGIRFMVRPLIPNNKQKSQLSRIDALSIEFGDKYRDCELYSFVAWDHVSWPGNDYYSGARVTDDGVKAAATDTMFVMTGIKGTYSKELKKYVPPTNYTNWRQVVNQNNISLRVTDNVFVY